MAGRGDQSEELSGLSGAFEIAVIGDVHGRWNDADRAWFDASPYDLMLFVGDIATHRGDGHDVVRNIAKLKKRTLLMPGNHDGVSLPHLAAEALNVEALLPFLSLEQPARRRRFAAAAHPLALCGYCSHPVTTSWGELTIIGARPHSMGGTRVSFRQLLKRLFDVDDLDSSAGLLRALVDEASDEIIFLAHNGPAGLGSKRDDIWGCDFKKVPEDFGDADLRLAIDHAIASGKRVRAVVAGHMHHQLKKGGIRRWRENRDGTEYVNAARVPRIERPKGGDTVHRHHHVKLSLTDETIESEAIVIEL